MFKKEAVSNGLQPVHPGEILRDELDELGISAGVLAEDLAAPTNRVTAILNGQRSITADTALRLSRYFGASPQLWMNLQKTFELRLAEIESGKDIKEKVQPREVAHVASGQQTDGYMPTNLNADTHHPCPTKH